MISKWTEIKPFLSLLIIICSLFVIVFAKMEKTRLSYQLYQQNKILKKTKEAHSLKLIELVEKTRLDRLRYLALTKLTLSEAKKGQIIQITGDKIVIAQ
ncbi:MAG: histidine kinase [Bdellovibrionales bacterium]